MMMNSSVSKMFLEEKKIIQIPNNRKDHVYCTDQCPLHTYCVGTRLCITTGYYHVVMQLVHVTDEI
jgi:hypothetical protein